MNRFQDLSSNRFNSKPRTRLNRFHSGPTPQSEANTSSFQRNHNLNDNSRFRSNLPTNSRWKRDEPTSSANNEPFTKRRNTIHSTTTVKVDPTFEPSELNSKFVNLNSMAMDFSQITVKPKQKKNKKNKKNNAHNKNTSQNQNTAPKKYSKKYDLTDTQQDDLKNSIINQYNYEEFDEDESESEQ